MTEDKKRELIGSAIREMFQDTLSDTQLIILINHIFHASTMTALYTNTNWCTLDTKNLIPIIHTQKINEDEENYIYENDDSDDDDEILDYKGFIRKTIETINS